jgi:hypothetical protein
MVIASDDIRYIGRSIDPWARWFDSPSKHAAIQNEDRIYPLDAIAYDIYENLPVSWEWTIRLYKPDELMIICAPIILSRPFTQLTKSRLYSRDPNDLVDQFEEILISYLSPAINVMHNPWPRNKQAYRLFMDEGRLLPELYYRRR